MTGFIAVQRSLWDHPLFAPAEMSEREAWIWMIAQAAWSDTRHRVGADVVEVKRGEFVTTLRGLQSAFMWRSDKRVRTFLKLLEKNGMIGRTTTGPANAQKTHVSICNYDEYQSGGRTADAPAEAKRTHRGRTADALKEQDNQITTEEEPIGSLSAEPTPAAAHVDEIAEAVALYNETAGQVGWSRVEKMSRQRRASLAARLKEAGGIEGWRTALAKARASPLCTGDNDRGWVASFDFLITKQKFTRLMEGQYDDRRPPQQSGSAPRGSFPSRDQQPRGLVGAAMRSYAGGSH